MEDIFSKALRTQIHEGKEWYLDSQNAVRVLPWLLQVQDQTLFRNIIEFIQQFKYFALLPWWLQEHYVSEPGLNYVSSWSYIFILL
jgi:hypothetical protein